MKTSAVSVPNISDNIEIPCLWKGTWTMGGKIEPDPHDDNQTHKKALIHALKKGVRAFDTAELYAGGISEKILGEAIESWDGKRSELFLASKINGDNAYPERIHQACKESLQRMGIKYFDLYYLHWRNLEFDLKAQIESLENLVDNGLIKAIGVSNFNTSSLKEAQSYCRKYKIIANQVYWSLHHREAEADGLLEYCREQNIGLIAWRPLEKGILLSEGEGIALLDTLVVKYSNQTGKNLTRAAIALNWLISQGIAPIFKSSTSTHIDGNLKALGWTMEADDIKILRNNFPHTTESFLGRPLS